jgi:thioester reductase-like protein
MPEHFFITGGTGNVGLQLLPRILRKFPGSSITLLVRGANETEAADRIHNITETVIRDEGISDAASRIRGVHGDVLREHCGLSSSLLAQVIQETTYIVHGAATIRFDHPLKEAREINCGGTRHMLAVAEQCVTKGRLKRFVYIGTSSVSGQREGIIREDELEMGQTFFNTYEHSKCESERIVRDHFPRIPAVIFRPSIIIGDSRTGRTRSFNVIYIPLRLLSRGLLRFIPGTRETRLDLVPIDWVDDVMVHIMALERSVGKVCHVTAGPDRAARLGDVVEGAVAYFAAHAPSRRSVEVRFVTSGEFDRRRTAARGMEEALLAQLDTLLPYVGIERLFISGTTDALLEGSGIVFPRYAEYDEKILSYCLRTNWGKKPA